MLSHLHSLNLILWQNYHDFVQLVRCFPDLDYLWKKVSKNELEENKISEKAQKIFLEKRTTIDPDKEMKKLEQKKITVFALTDQDYPSTLKNIHTPPLLLYLKGNIDFDWQKSISIVGTRRPSPYGMIIAEQFSKALAECDLVVVSGLAVGIDSIAHSAVVSLKRRTIAVLGAGVDCIYPPCNNHLAEKIIEYGGALLSEFPPCVTAYPSNFPRRNRIIAGLTRGTLVVEGQKKSGSLITARFAIEAGKEVFAIPGDITRPQSQATNHLIAQSLAHATTTPETILHMLGIKSNKLDQKSSELSESETRILSHLKQIPMNGEELLYATKLPLQKVQIALSMLELKGLVRREREIFYAGGL